MWTNHGVSIYQLIGKLILRFDEFDPKQLWYPGSQGFVSADDPSAPVASGVTALSGVVTSDVGGPLTCKMGGSVPNEMDQPHMPKPLKGNTAHGAGIGDRNTAGAPRRINAAGAPLGRGTGGRQCE